MNLKKINLLGIISCIIFILSSFLPFFNIYVDYHSEEFYLYKTEIFLDDMFNIIVFGLIVIIGVIAFYNSFVKSNDKPQIIGGTLFLYVLSMIGVFRYEALRGESVIFHIRNSCEECGSWGLVRSIGAYGYYIGLALLTLYCLMLIIYKVKRQNEAID